MGKHKASEKEIFELWWEYLKESKGYKKWLETGLKEYKTYLDQLNNYRLSDPPMLRMTGDPKWETLFHMFGDIHTTPFERWWERRKNRRNTNPLFKEIDDYSNWVGFAILQCFTNMKEKATDQKTFEDQFRSAFVNRMKSSPGLYLTVDVNADLDFLTKEFRRLILKHRKEKESELWPFRIHRYLSITRVRFNELKEYLSTYREDLRRKEKNREKNWKQIMEAVNPEYKKAISDPKKQETIRSLYYTHLANAKKLIKNAENGNFPGDYR